MQEHYYQFFFRRISPTKHFARHLVCLWVVKLLKIRLCSRSWEVFGITATLLVHSWVTREHCHVPLNLCCHQEVRLTCSTASTKISGHVSPEGAVLPEAGRVVGDFWALSVPCLGSSLVLSPWSYLISVRKNLQVEKGGGCSHFKNLCVGITNLITHVLIIMRERMRERLLGRK